MSDAERKEVAATIESFLDGSCRPYDWDDLISIPRSDATFDVVCRYCASTSDLYPTPKTTEWCSDQGATKLRELAALLRSDAGDEKIEAFVQNEYAKV
jgi:hypothetical protein